KHAINRKAELFRNDLRVSCFVALALRLRSETRNHFAGRVNANLRTVEHLDPENVEMLRWTSTDDLREAADTDAHQLTAPTFVGLFLSQFGISDFIHRQLQRAGVVATVVLPIERRLVRKLLRLDEVLHAKVRRVHAQLMGHHISHALDRVYRFSDTER